MSVDRLNRAAATAAWASAALRGSTGVEHAQDVLHSFFPFLLFHPHDDPTPLTLPFAVARWRRLHVAGWQYVPVAPGDLNGLPGPASFSASALDVGVGLVALGTAEVPAPDLGLVPSDPDDQGAWFEVRTDRPARRDETTASDAERAMLEALNHTVSLVEEHDLAHWGAGLRDMRASWTHSIPAPPGTSSRSERLIQRSGRVLEIVTAAQADEGGSRTLTEMQTRRGALGELERAARRAHAVAWNTGLSTAHERR